MKRRIASGRTFDLRTFIVVPVFITVIALVACLIPGLRAARIDPLAALRSS